MPAIPQTDEIARQFGLESIPESVQRLNQLLAKRDASTEDIAKLVSQDKDLAARLLRAAGLIEPRQHSAAESRIANWKGYHLDTLPRGAATKPDLFYMEAVKP